MPGRAEKVSAGNIESYKLYSKLVPAEVLKEAIICQIQRHFHADPF